MKQINHKICLLPDTFMKRNFYFRVNFSSQVMNMKKYLTILFLAAQFGIAQSMTVDTLYLPYYSHSPFAYSENNEVIGIEPDIIREYTAWLRDKKKISVYTKYIEYRDFSGFYSEVKTSSRKNIIGMGSVTVLPERAEELDFTTGTIKSVALCITNGHAPELKTKTPAEILKVMGSMSALTITNTSLSNYVNDVKKTYIKDLKISYLSDESKILDKISTSVLSFGFVDAVTFRDYLKNNPNKYFKVQSVMNRLNEEMGFIMPKGSRHKVLFNEFFATFKTTAEYRQILEKHLGTFMAQNMIIQ
ncbi:MAG: transporter substrate-binding domain-containing protein [Bacteroidetes bacterium]|nr:transporter substrate-binding domain-containing protein [Bacteroidota bacterium]